MLLARQPHTPAHLEASTHGSSCQTATHLHAAPVAELHDDPRLHAARRVGGVVEGSTGVQRVIGALQHKQWSKMMNCVLEVLLTAAAASDKEEIHHPNVPKHLQLPSLPVFQSASSTGQPTPVPIHTHD